MATRQIPPKVVWICDQCETEEVVDGFQPRGWFIMQCRAEKYLRSKTTCSHECARKALDELADR